MAPFWAPTRSRQACSEAPAAGLRKSRLQAPWPRGGACLICQGGPILNYFLPSLLLYLPLCARLSLCCPLSRPFHQLVVSLLPPPLPPQDRRTARRRSPVLWRAVQHVEHPRVVVHMVRGLPSGRQWREECAVRQAAHASDRGQRGGARRTPRWRRRRRRAARRRRPAAQQQQLLLLLPAAR